MTTILRHSNAYLSRIEWMLGMFMNEMEQFL